METGGWGKGGWRGSRGSESLVVTGHPLPLPFLEAIFIKRETVGNADIFSTEEITRK